MHDIGKHLVLVDVAHEELIAVFRRKSIAEVEAGTPMGRLVMVVSDGGDVIVDVGVKMGLGLLVVGSTLDDVEDVRDDAASGKGLTSVVEIKAPWVGEAVGEDFEFLFDGMVAPDSTVDELTFGIGNSDFSDEGGGEDAVASVEPAVRSPDK